jgi:hypothetical protein
MQARDPCCLDRLPVENGVRGAFYCVWRYATNVLR